MRSRPSTPVEHFAELVLGSGFEVISLAGIRFSGAADSSKPTAFPQHREQTADGAHPVVRDDGDP
jgi:hypothetical protein